MAAIDDYHRPHGEEPYWWSIKENEPDLLNRLQDKALEESFYIFKNENPQDCKKYIINAIQEAKKFPSVAVYERLGISVASFNKIIEEYPDLKSECL